MPSLIENRREQIIKAVAQTAGLGPAVARELAEVMDRATAARAGRAAAAVLHRREYSATLRAGIRKAAGALAMPSGNSLNHRITILRNRINARGLATYGLQKLPSRRLIAEVLKQLDAEQRRDVSEPKRESSGFTIAPTST